MECIVVNMQLVILPYDANIQDDTRFIDDPDAIGRTARVYREQQPRSDEVCRRLKRQASRMQVAIIKISGDGSACVRCTVQGRIQYLPRAVAWLPESSQ